MSPHAFAPGKMILSGEYAVLFGYRGIAFPTSAGISAEFSEDTASAHVSVAWRDADVDGRWREYAEKIVAHCRPHARGGGRLFIHSNLPLRKGMGSSTALVIALTRVLVGEGTQDVARHIEDKMNPGHSGLDFACIWGGEPIVFRRGVPAERRVLPLGLREEGALIDTGVPNDATSTLVAWIKEREEEVRDALATIGNCTERIIAGEPLFTVVRDHHRAQARLGVVPRGVQQLIASIEEGGGAAKIIGAGSRSGGGGMVLALGDEREIRAIAQTHSMPTMPL